MFTALPNIGVYRRPSAAKRFFSVCSVFSVARPWDAVLDYLPRNCGARFSMNALTPSL